MIPASFYRRVWRWHFWMGLVCAPVLVVTALTGAVYVFKDEIEAAGRSDWAYVTPAGDRKSFDELVATVRTNFHGESPRYATVYAASDRSTVVQIQRTEAGKTVTRLVFINPYTAAVLGEIRPSGPGSFFSVVIRLHTSLYTGRLGRATVELVTAWTIVLTVTGIYLWWPNRLTNVYGVWLPRFRAPLYTVIRDLHALPGIGLAGVIVLLALTGLFFTQLWGGTYSALVGSAGKYPFDLTEPPVRPAVNGPGVPIETAVTEAQNRFPGSTMMVEFPAKSTDPHAITTRHPTGDMVFGFVAVDRSTGEVVADRKAADVPFPAQIRLWVYPIHVGSVYGTPTKVLAVLGCLVLAFAAVSGVAMWLVRRPRGSGGFPAASNARVPPVAVGTILVLAVLLPTVGASLVLVLAAEWVWDRDRPASIPSPPRGEGTGKT